MLLPQANAALQRSQLRWDLPNERFSLLVHAQVNLTSVGLATNCPKRGGTALRRSRSARVIAMATPASQSPRCAPLRQRTIRYAPSILTQRHSTPRCNFYRFFPLLVIMALIPASLSPVWNPVLQTRMPILPAAPVGSSQPKPKLARKKGEPCTRTPCRRPRAVRFARAKCQISNRMLLVHTMISEDPERASQHRSPHRRRMAQDV